MDNLEQLLARYGERQESRYWIGERPDVRDGQMKKAILSAIGYPNVQDDHLIEQDWCSAARILAFTGTRSLAYDSSGPSASSQADALKALCELDGTAQFFSNGNWGAPVGIYEEIGWYG
jgi:hypothetical protein